MSMFEYLFTTLAGFTLLLIGLSVLGVIVFISGILNQIGGMIEALETMVKATDISPQLVMSGLMESFKVPIFCSFVLIISLIFWYFNKKKWEVLNSKDS